MALSSHHSPHHNTHALHARPVAQTELEAAGTLLGICFEEEPWSAALVEVLDNPAARRRFLRETSTNDVRTFARHGSALIVDAWESDHLPTLQSELTGLPAGGILFDADGALTPEQHAAHWQESLQRGYSALTKQEVERVKQRVAQLDAVENDSWCATRYPNGYAYVCMVGVNPRYRGQGVLRALFKPVFEVAQQTNLPVCLECYSTRLTEIYRHQGFDLVDTETWDEIGLTQFRMVSFPKQAR